MTKFKAGMKVKIIGNTTNHSHADGDIVTLTGKHGSNWMTDGGCYVAMRDIKPAELTPEEIKAEIDRLKNEVSVLENRLKWMEETKTTIYDETEFKVWMTLKAMDRKMSPIERARLIAKIIKGD